MKIFRYFFLILLSSVFVSCKDTSEPPLLGDWDRRTVFPTSARSHCATFVIDNRGYVVSGFNGDNPPRREVYAFNHEGGGFVVGGHAEGRTMGNWERLSPLPDYIEPRQQAVGFSLTAGGKKYGFIGSGFVFRNREYETVKDFWRYDPSDDSWEEVAPLPESAHKRRGAFAFSLEVDGKWYGYVGGGHTDRPDNEYLNDLWRFDPEGSTNGLPGSWEEIHDRSFEKRLGAVAFVIDNKAYICNGEKPDPINDFWVYDGHSWYQKRTMNAVHPDDSYDDDYGPLGRSFGVAFVVPASGGKARGHIVGGRQSNSGFTCWEYDEEFDLWTRRTSFINNSNSISRQGMVSFFFPESGRAFVGMGLSGISAYHEDMWEFIPLEDDLVYRDRQ